MNKLFWLGLSLFTLNATAQVDTDAEWKESEAPPPPSFSKERLIPIDMPRYVTVKFGVDPATLTLTADGLVRYVVVMTNASGSTTAVYEAIRCATWEVKTYSRYTSNGQWASVQTPSWKDLSDNLPSKHAISLARQGVCDGGTTAASSVAAIVKALKQGQVR